MNLPDESYAVLNGVYLRKMVTIDVLHDITAMPADEIRSVLDDLATQGLAVDVGGGNWMLEQPDGVRAAIAAYDERYSDLRTSQDVLTWYERFEVLNAQFLTTLSAWQTSGSDDAALDKVLRLVDRQIKVLTSFVGFVPRYQRYADRFEAATEKVEAGHTEWVTSLTLDSVHNVWFELHEDILTVLGRPRDVAEAEHG
ncbi:hypothetical protein [Nocardioides sp.]|uniref:hypothetical protein n=1 Tax=Nocardioides sp. TaxID=35761 RepID=UPI002634DF06|nr:hypothetical protein [Nocardioides sp.]MCW2736687.1 hypothetical protein [Nocardioides sp.]